MHISEDCKNFIKNEEGLRLTAYLCPTGHWTIGYGHTPATKGQKVNGAQADALINQDLARFEAAVTELVKVPLTQHQFDALVSFSFNVGTSSLAKSTLLKKLNQGNYTAVPKLLMMWCHGNNGIILDGLTKRREGECAFWNRTK